MILYTPVDEAIIFADMEQKAPKLEEVALANGITLLVERLEEGSRIERVICGNANVYLMAEYQPGQVIKIP